jgi:hypothetical protein
MYSTERVPAMNVSKQADAMFMAELKRTDRERYDRLIRNMEREAARLRRLSQPGTVTTMQRRCQHCGLALPSDIRSDRQYCDGACKKAAYRLAKAA